MQFLDLHFRLGGAGMAGDIVERFLGDAIEHRSFVPIHLLDCGKGRQADPDAGFFPEGFHKRVEAGISPRSSSTVGRSSRANRWTMLTERSTNCCVCAMLRSRPLVFNAALFFK